MLITHKPMRQVKVSLVNRICHHITTRYVQQVALLMPGLVDSGQVVAALTHMTYRFLIRAMVVPINMLAMCALVVMVFMKERIHTEQPGLASTTTLLTSLTTHMT